MKSTTKPQSRGFTLVEILVVIAIIGILVAILVPTLAASVKSAREGAIRMELTQLEMAMEDYKNNNGNSYPPDFTTGQNFDNPADVADTGLENVTRRLQDHVRKISSSNQEPSMHLSTNDPNAPKNSATMETLFDRVVTLPGAAPIAPDGVPDITPDEALVYWLSGTSKNLAFPLSGAGDPNTGTGERRVYYEFKEDQLEDFDNDGFPSYVPAYGPKIPYVYFHHGTYAIAAFQPNLHGFADTPPAPTGEVIQARPYADPEVLTLSGGSWIPNGGHWVSPDSFQIICAGLDGDYGTYPTGFDMSVAVGSRLNLTMDTTNNGVAVESNNTVRTYGLPLVRKYFPDGWNMGRRDHDNLSSIADRRLDKDLAD